MTGSSAAEYRVRQELTALLPRLRRFARFLTRNPHDADDLVQVAAERALTRASQWREAEGINGWVFGIMRNAWIDEIRGRQRRGKTFLPEEAGENVGVSPGESQQIGLSVRQAMQRLPEEQQHAVLLVLVEGLSYREAADALDIPVGTLTSRLARGRAALQELLGEAGGKP